MRTLKVGIIGLGVGETNIPAFENHHNCEVVAVCDFSDERMAAVKEKMPDVILSSKADEILNYPGIDMVSIASNDDYHYVQVVRAIKNGKHVFVEKPICLYPYEAIEIRRLLNNNPKIKISSNLNLRTCPRFIRLKQAALAREIGKIFYMESDYIFGKSRIHRLIDGWRTDMDFYSIIYGGAVHMIDLLLWITEMKPITIQGFGNRIAVEESRLKYNDFVSMLFKFQNGMVAKVSVSGGCIHPHFHKVTVYGTEKTFIHDIFGARLLEFQDSEIKGKQWAGKYPSYKEKGEVITKDIDWEYPGVKEKSKVITSFIDSILDSNVEPVVSCDDIFTTMSVCFAAENAVEKGKTQKIEYI